jgi:hypothetical protein
MPRKANKKNCKQKDKKKKCTKKAWAAATKMAASGAATPTIIKSKSKACCERASTAGVTRLRTQDGSSSFGVTSTILVSAIISQYPNFSETRGFVSLTDIGLVVGKTGRYCVTIQAAMSNQIYTGSVTVPILLVINDTTPSGISGTLTLQQGRTAKLKIKSTIKLNANSRLSLVATAGSVLVPVQTLIVVGWSILVIAV